jgi:hypothetical protein
MNARNAEVMIVGGRLGLERRTLPSHGYAIYPFAHRNTRELWIRAY